MEAKGHRNDHAPPIAGFELLRGFGLLELVVVIAIIAILSALAIASLSRSQLQQGQIAAEELTINLRYVRDMAIHRERRTKVVFNVAASSYTVTVADTNAPSGYVPAKDPVTQTDWIVSISDEFSGVGLASANINGNSILCFSETNGIPCDASGTPIVADGKITFDSGLTVNIVPNTGYVY